MMSNLLPDGSREVGYYNRKATEKQEGKADRLGGLLATTRNLRLAGNNSCGNFQEHCKTRRTWIDFQSQVVMHGQMVRPFDPGPGSYDREDKGPPIKAYRGDFLGYSSRGGFPTVGRRRPPL